MNDMAQDLQSVAQQAKAPVLAEVTQVSGIGALTPVQSPSNLEPVQPKHLAVEDIQAIEAKADEFIEKIKADPSDWQLGNFVFSLGQEIMDETQAQVTLYDRKMGNVLKNVATDNASPVGKNILAIKMELDKVNPTMVARAEMPFQKKMLGLFTKTVNRLPKGDEILRIIAERRETVNSTIDGIRDHLRNEADQVAFDASELSTICDSLKEIQPRLQEKIYLGQVIWQKLMEHLKTIEDPRNKEALTTLTSDLAMAVVDLQTIDNSNLQTRFGGEMMVRNSHLVRRLVQRTDMILSTAVKNALAVRVAAEQQMETLQHLDMVQKAAAETMKDTATVIGNAAIKGAQMSQSMTVNIEALEQACQTYEQAFETYALISQETINIASQSSNALGKMNDRFRARTDALTARRQDN
ncbi:MAG: toxic anion resistance protein [Proteobacteria bacterium]|nr:toxic anion resistance protein [Pseudomonadota bacterium]MBU1583807.1 toxic anion resistance protein [Pseudomonadota bacterium]MBU2455468.1 toxic anion resistance protein [Pseudomonadota bacterium]MBU2627567.1 toxic anion resistance protein [Pseudomonadota bacterium]